MSTPETERDVFFKGHALGNDYLVIDVATLNFALSPSTVRALCDRQRGVGADGVIALLGEVPGGRNVQVWNPDGSQAEVSGNGLRIAALALGVQKPGDALTLFSAGKPYKVTCGARRTLAIDLPPAQVAAAPFPLVLDGKTVPVLGVSVGNPHAVVALKDAGDEADWPALAAALAVHPHFRAGVNVARLEVRDRATIAILVHERGVGPTSASGTGACAAAAAAAARGEVDPGPVRVVMPGGTVFVGVGADRLRLEGQVSPVYRGSLDPGFVLRLTGRGA